MANKVVLLVGAGSSGPGWGNGKAAAVLYARQGAKVFATDINKDAVEETCKIIAEEGGEATAFAGDVLDEASVKEMVDRCVATYGRIDVLHNNVGRGVMGSATELTGEQWEQGMNIGVKSMFLTCKYTLPIMEKQGGGAIVNISSIAGIRHLGYDSLTYSVGKAAVNQFTKQIALNYATKGIRANALLPGFMDTPLVHRVIDGVPRWKIEGYESGEAYSNARHGQVPMGHMGDAWDVAYAALFLASDEARYITATELVVDGGIVEMINLPKR